MIQIEQLVWDAWNVEHIQKHSVIPAEVEKALGDSRIKYKEGYSSRLVALGKSGKRLLSVVLAKEGQNKFYVVTARDMDKKERAIYREENQHNA